MSVKHSRPIAAIALLLFIGLAYAVSTNQAGAVFDVRCSWLLTRLRRPL